MSSTISVALEAIQIFNRTPYQLIIYFLFYILFFDRQFLAVDGHLNRKRLMYRWWQSGSTIQLFSRTTANIWFLFVGVHHCHYVGFHLLLQQCSTLVAPFWCLYARHLPGNDSQRSALWGPRVTSLRLIFGSCLGRLFLS